MNVTVYGPNLPRQLTGPAGETFVVHREGCGDCRRYRAEDGWTLEATTQREVVHELYPPEDFDYGEDEYGSYAGDVHFAPCVRLSEGER